MPVRGYRSLDGSLPLGGALGKCQDWQDYSFVQWFLNYSHRCQSTLGLSKPDPSCLFITVHGLKLSKLHYTKSLLVTRAALMCWMDLMYLCCKIWCIWDCQVRCWMVFLSTHFMPLKFFWIHLLGEWITVLWLSKLQHHKVSCTTRLGNRISVLWGQLQERITVHSLIYSCSF